MIALMNASLGRSDDVISTGTAGISVMVLPNVDAEGDRFCMLTLTRYGGKTNKVRSGLDGVVNGGGIVHRRVRVCECVPDCSCPPPHTTPPPPAAPVPPQRPPPPSYTLSA